jgi:hypothetical protein
MPTLVRLTRRALEGGPTAPSKPFPRGSAGSSHGVRPAGAPSPPLLVLCSHPRACSTTPGTATTTPALLGTRGRDAATPAIVPRTDHRQQLPRARLRTPRPTTTPSPSKPPLFQYGTCHNDKTVARTVRTAANSVALHAILSHVAKQCGMPVTHPLLDYKRKVNPLAAGDDRQRTTHTLPNSPTILAPASITTLGT